MNTIAITTKQTRKNLDTTITSADKKFIFFPQISGACTDTLTTFAYGRADALVDQNKSATYASPFPFFAIADSLSGEKEYLGLVDGKTITFADKKEWENALLSLTSLVLLGEAEWCAKVSLRPGKKLTTSLDFLPKQWEQYYVTNGIYYVGKNNEKKYFIVQNKMAREISLADLEKEFISAADDMIARFTRDTADDLEREAQFWIGKNSSPNLDAFRKNLGM